MAGGNKLRLACQHGTYGMQEAKFKRLGEASWAAFVPCDLGDHYLRPDPAEDGAFTFSVEPYGFPTPEDAWAAADTHAANLAKRYR